MRTITEKDKLGLAEALHRMIVGLKGRKQLSSKYAENISTALDAGITMDELLNPKNYLRAAAKIENPSPADYIELLINREIPAIPISAENDWQNSSFKTNLAFYFHDFFTCICTVGGSVNSPIMQNNILSLIEKYSFQAILSEELIKTVQEKTELHDKLTTYQYIDALTGKKKNPFPYNIDTSLTSEQQARQDALKEEIEKEEEIEHEAENDESTGDATEETEESIEETIAETETEPVVLTGDNDSAYKGEEFPTEPEPEDTDSEDSADPDEEQNELIPFDVPEYMEETNKAETDFYANADAACPSPFLYKLNALLAAVKNLRLEEIARLCEILKNEEDGINLHECIYRMAEGHYKDIIDNDCILSQARQYINGDLRQQFEWVAKMQGITISKEQLDKLDLLNMDWDMRDPDTKTLMKLRELIYSNEEAAADKDIERGLKDLENLYSERK